MGCLDPPLQQLPGKDTQYFCTACAKRPVRHLSICRGSGYHIVIIIFDLHHPDT